MERSSEVVDKLKWKGHPNSYSYWCTKRERYSLTLTVPIEEASSYWCDPLFDGQHAEIIKVSFFEVKFDSINSYLGGSFCLMADPSNPVHSRLFKFQIETDWSFMPSGTKLESCTVVFQKVKKEDKHLFERLLSICEQKFYSPGIINLLTRKNVGKAKRRYLLFLARENRVPYDLLGAVNFQVSEATRQKMTIGNLEDAEGIWNRLVEREKVLQGL